MLCWCKTNGHKWILKVTNCPNEMKQKRWATQRCCLHPEQHSCRSATHQFIQSCVSCLMEHFVVCSAAPFSPLKRGENRGSSLCCFVNWAMLLQSVVRDPRRWSNTRLNLVLYFHVSHSRLWYIIIWRFICLHTHTHIHTCRCCTVNMCEHSLDAFVEPQSAMACLWLGQVSDFWQLFYGLQSALFIWPCKADFAHICFRGFWQIKSQCFWKSSFKSI